jgi:hypothetical protein
MVRVTLATYLILALAVSPCLCCLKLRSIAAAAETGVCPHCRRDHPAKEGRTSLRDRTGPEAPTPCRDCPCGSGHRPVATLGQPENLIAEPILKSATPTWDTAVAAVDEPAVRAMPGTAARESAVFPYCTARDILSSIQVLRC